MAHHWFENSAPGGNFEMTGATGSASWSADTARMNSVTRPGQRGHAGSLRVLQKDTPDVAEEVRCQVTEVAYMGPGKVEITDLDYPELVLKDGPGVNPANVGRKVPHGAT